MNTDKYSRMFNLLFGITASICVVHMLAAFFVERSLWVDEAMLMKNVLTRSYEGIIEGVFDYNQSAPLGYMLAVKTFTLLFGESPMAMRLYSLLMFFASSCLVYLISKRMLKFNFPLMPLAFFLGVGIVQYYANEAKPYMGDVFFSLLAIWMYQLYVTKKMPFVVVALIMGMSVWFAFGALFTIGGVCAYHFFSHTYLLSHKKGDFAHYAKEVSPLLVVLASVGLYYFLWALPASRNVPDTDADNFWTFLSFPLIPRSFDDLKVIFKMGREMVSPIHKALLIQFIIALIFVIKVKYKSWLLVSFFISLLMIMIVSSLGMYPISLRLLLSQFVWISILAFWGLDWLVGNMAKNKYTCLVLLVLILLPCALTLRPSLDFRRTTFYRGNEEFKKCFEYIKEHKGPDAKVYICPLQRPVAEYYTDYTVCSTFEEKKIIEKNDLIWGTVYRQLQCSEAYVYRFYKKERELQVNLDAIRKHKDVYLVDVHKEAEVIDWLIEGIKAAGMKVTKEYSFLGSHVYRCQK